MAAKSSLEAASKFFRVSNKWHFAADNCGRLIIARPRSSNSRRLSYLIPPSSAARLPQTAIARIGSSRFGEGESVLRHAFVKLESNRNMPILPPIVVDELVPCIVIGIKRLIKLGREGVDPGSHPMY
jgi:hypothetical protein